MQIPYEVGDIISCNISNRYVYSLVIGALNKSRFLEDMTISTSMYAKLIFKSSEEIFDMAYHEEASLQVIVSSISSVKKLPLDVVKEHLLNKNVFRGYGLDENGNKVGFDTFMHSYQLRYGYYSKIGKIEDIDYLKTLYMKSKLLVDFDVHGELVTVRGVVDNSISRLNEEKRKIQNDLEDCYYLIDREYNSEVRLVERNLSNLNLYILEKDNTKSFCYYLDKGLYIELYKIDKNSSNKEKCYFQSLVLDYLGKEEIAKYLTNEIKRGLTNDRYVKRVFLDITSELLSIPMLNTDNLTSKEKNIVSRVLKGLR